MGKHIQGSDKTCHVLLGTQLQHKDGGCSCSCGCGGIGSYDTLHPVLPEPVAQAAVGAAAGSVLAVDTWTAPPSLLPLAVLGIRGGPVITPAGACTHQLE